MFQWASWMCLEQEWPAESVGQPDASEAVSLETVC